MTKKWMLASVSAIATLALGAPAGGAATTVQPMTVGHLSGTMRVQQKIPCDGNLDQTTPVTGGRLVMTPSEGVDVPGGKTFALVGGSVSFAAFSMSGSCDTVSRTQSYSQVSVQLSRAVTFTATAAGGGVYNISIPASDLVIYEASIVNGADETGYKVPSQDVTGTIDLTNGVVSLHVVLATSVHFQGGCTPIGCLVDETDSGTVTADVAGTIAFADSDGDGVPDRTDNCRFVANPDQSAVATPVVSPPPNVTIASCLSQQIGNASAIDVCDGGPVSLTSNAPAQFPLGGSTVVWTATDQKSRVGTASQIVTVVDTTAPAFTLVPPALTRNTCGPVDLGQATATDDCAGRVAVANDAPASFFVGTTPVTWTATDVSGNHASATQTVTVVDTVPPTVSCVADGPPGGTFLVTAGDACGAPTIALGSYAIANGERIKINETGQSGVRLIGMSDGVRHFHVGKGQAIITATDGSGNTATVSCR